MRIVYGVACGFLVSLCAGDAARAQAPKVTAGSSVDSAVVAAERAIWELLKRQQWDAFDAAIAGETLVEPGGISITTPGTSAKTLPGLVTRSYSLEDLRVRTIAPDVVLLTYKASVDQTFKGERTPSPLYMLSLWQRKGAKWTPVAHAETPASTAR
jgi:Domain of unknown function (DUF4440)